MDKKKVLTDKKVLANVKMYVLLGAILVVAIIAGFSEFNKNKVVFEDGIAHIGPNKVVLKDSHVQVDFSDIILSKQNEMRLLKVSEQEATVTTKLTDRLIQGIDWKIFKKTQNVSYKGQGSFVVDLNTITKDSIINDKSKKLLTIKIDHARLDTILVDPNKIIVDDVNKGLLNWGKIDLTVKDYTNLEKEIQSKLKEKFNTSANAQEADDIALVMVKETYEPVIKAIDKDYTVIVEFK